MLSFLWAAIKMVVEQESKRFLSQVTGKVPAQNLPKMLETGTVVISTILGVFHKKAVVETSRRYSMDFLGDREDSGFEKTT
jgi:hypothetical protein